MQPQNRFKEPLRPNATRWPGKTYFIILFTTIALLVAFTISFFVILAVQGNDDPSDNEGDKGGVVNTVTKAGAKTGIKLPSSTTSGSFLSSSSGSTESITGISSEAAILVELGENVSVAEKNADVVIYPASMTKVMTLLVACERAQNPNVKLTVTQDMVDFQQEMGGSGNLGFVAGDAITVEDALYLINYRSDTIACLLIADYVAKGEEAFVDLMNEKALEIGLTNTNFTNCTGLHNVDHYTTCREMAAIMKCAISNPTVKKIITSYEGYTVDIYADGKVERQPIVYSGWYSERMGDNPWAGNGSDVKVLGGKTGYEDIPTSCFVTYAQNTETKDYYICVTVGRVTKEGDKVSNSKSTTDTKIIYRNYAD